jgi:hypothetical protein
MGHNPGKWREKLDCHGHQWTMPGGDGERSPLECHRQLNVEPSLTFLPFYGSGSGRRAGGDPNPTAIGTQRLAGFTRKDSDSRPRDSSENSESESLSADCQPSAF